MNRVICAGILFFFLAIPSGFADYRGYLGADDLLEGRWVFSFYIDRVMPEASYDNDIGYFGALEYNWTHNIAFELEGGHFTLEEESENLGGQKTGELTLTPLLANIKWRFFTQEDFKVFVFGGAGFAFPEYKEEPWINLQGVSVDFGTGLSYQFGGGLEYFVNDNFAIVTKAGLFKSTEAEEYTATWGGVVDTMKVELDHLFARVGLEFLF